MHALRSMYFVENKLFLRDPMNAVTSILAPAAALVVLGLVPGNTTPKPRWDNLSFVDYFAPSLFVVTVAVLAFLNLPSYMTAYREKGVLRRLNTTPVSPVKLIAAQLLTQLTAAVVAFVLLLVVGGVGFGLQMPAHPVQFILAFLLGFSALLTLGMLVAAVLPNSRGAFGAGFFLFAATLFVSGVYAPRKALPEVIANLSNYFPPGVPALQGAWTGVGVQPLQLVAMAAIVLVIGPLAAKLFRWS